MENGAGFIFDCMAAGLMEQLVSSLLLLVFWGAALLALLAMTAGILRRAK
jgi:hypothetical protein